LDFAGLIQHSCSTARALKLLLCSNWQAKIERLHELCKASAQQVLGIHTALRRSAAKRLAV
jgi:hypothetical protein